MGIELECRLLGVGITAVESVAHDGAQFVQQGLEAVRGRTVMSVLGGDLLQRGIAARRWRDGVGLGHLVPIEIGAADSDLRSSDQRAMGDQQTTRNP